MRKIGVLLVVLGLFTSCKKESEQMKVEEKEVNTIEEKKGDVVEDIKFDKIEQLDWLVGNWINDSGVEQSYENWKKVNDSTLTAHSYTLLGEDTVFAEKITLAQNGNDVFFIVNAYLEKEDQVVIFKMIDDSDKGVFSFENPKHDYPKRIVYTNPVKDSIHAWIEGTVEGEFRKVDFLFRRVN